MTTETFLLKLFLIVAVARAMIWWHHVMLRWEANAGFPAEDRTTPKGAAARSTALYVLLVSQILVFLCHALATERNPSSVSQGIASDTNIERRENTTATDRSHGDGRHG